MTTALSTIARPLIGAALALSSLLGLGATLVACDKPAPTGQVNIYEEEDLSGAPYGEPVSILVVHRSAGWVCYANDRTGQDQRQMYVSCSAYVKAGGRISN